MKFALITEGASEHRVIKHIVSKYFKDIDPEINQIQPKLVNDKQETAGGWNEVLKYCERDELKDILVENDYLIIQIDTDQSQTRPFSVSHTNVNGQPKTPDELHADVIQKIDGLIKVEIKQEYGQRIFLAICIHTIECWLLPLFYDNTHRNGKNNCLQTLNQALSRNNVHIIPVGNKNSPNSIRSYDTILKKIKRKKDIADIAQYNVGFGEFVHSLSTIG